MEGAEKVADLRDLFSLVPACAGVIPGLESNTSTRKTCPRVCGGDPLLSCPGFQRGRLSPRVRG